MDPASSPSSPDNTSIWHMLPYIALPLIILIAFSCPPFPGRGIGFAILIILTDYATIVSPWPPNSGATRPMRYGMAGSWLFVLPALERLLLHVPERDFWRLDDEKAASKGRPDEWTWAKVRWAAALASSPRAVGWNFGSRKIAAARDEMRRNRPSRLAFVASSFGRAAMAYFTLDAVVLAARTISIPAAWSWDIGTIGKLAYAEVLMGISVWATMSLQFQIVAGITVGLDLSQPEDWPPLFGSINQCYKISKVWGDFWHGYIRQPCLGFSHKIVEVLRIPRKSPVAYFLHLLTAFFISAFFHILSLAVICPGYFPLRSLVIHMSVFFLAQPPAAIVEVLVCQLLRKLFQAESDPSKKEKEKHGMISIETAGYALGYTWVFCWFVFTGWWFIQPYAAVGVLEWPLPFSIWGFFWQIN